MLQLKLSIQILFMAVIFASTLFAQENKKKSAPDKGNPVIVMKTSKGTIKIELYQDKAPVTAKNFLSYVDDKFFDSTIFHRVIGNFMIQGGGFRNENPMREKSTKEPIINESTNGLKNDRGTIAMARTTDPNSATSQFFINVVDNNSLNGSLQKPGYAVFGKVVAGMDVVDKIRAVETGNAPAITNFQGKDVKQTFQDVPKIPVVIESVYREKK